MSVAGSRSHVLSRLIAKRAEIASRIAAMVGPPIRSTVTGAMKVLGSPSRLGPALHEVDARFPKRVRLCHAVLVCRQDRVGEPQAADLYGLWAGRVLRFDDLPCAIKRLVQNPKLLRPEGGILQQPAGTHGPQPQSPRANLTGSLSRERDKGVKASVGIRVRQVEPEAGY